MSEELTFFKNEKKDIEEIFNVLKKYNINSTENLVQLKARKNGLLYAGDYPWVSEIAQIINTFYCDADRCISDITGKVFLVETMETENQPETVLHRYRSAEKAVLEQSIIDYGDCAYFAICKIHRIGTRQRRS